MAEESLIAAVADLQKWAQGIGFFAYLSPNRWMMRRRVRGFASALNVPIEGASLVQAPADHRA